MKILSGTTTTRESLEGNTLALDIVTFITCCREASETGDRETALPTICIRNKTTAVYNDCDMEVEVRKALACKPSLWRLWFECVFVQEVSLS